MFTMIRLTGTVYAENMRRGIVDDDPIIQAFARHRIAALADAERKLEDMGA